MLWFKRGSHTRYRGKIVLSDRLLGAAEFTAEDEWWLILFTQQAAVAINNANLYQKMQLSQQRAQTLAEMIGALNRSIEPQELFSQITEAACRLLKIPASALCWDNCIFWYKLALFIATAAC